MEARVQAASGREAEAGATVAALEAKCAELQCAAIEAVGVWDVQGGLCVIAADGARADVLISAHGMFQ